MSRTGRAFFDESDLEGQLIDRFRSVLDGVDFWDRQQTTWVLIDAELLPWSAKAQQLLQDQYSAVGAAGLQSRMGLSRLLESARLRGIDLGGLSERTESEMIDLQQFREAYRGYCWSVEGVADYRIAPFHLLATEGKVLVGQPHRWHLTEIDRWAATGTDFIQLTQRRWVDLSEPAQGVAAIDWWVQLTENGGEGMVVKPSEFVAFTERDLIQPALKVRGRKYLRLIYGPHYLAPDNLKKLKRRKLKHKRSLALREFALGVEALERFQRKEPLRRVHQCVFGIAALEQEPVDPAL